MPWRKPSSRRFFLDEPAPPHSISAASLDRLIGHREDGRRKGEAYSPNRRPPSCEALPTLVAVEVPLAKWVPSADRQDLCRQMNDKAS